LNNNVDSPIVLLGLARVNFELGNYDASKDIIKTIIERKDTDSSVKNQAYELLNKVLIKEQERYITLHATQEKPKIEQKTQEKPKVEENPVIKKTFAIQIGSFSSYDRADTFKKRIEAQLKDVRIVEQSGIYRVLYGRFPTREEAEKEKKNLLKNFNILGFIVEQ
jgi:cell division protein FtsN